MIPDTGLEHLVIFHLTLASFWAGDVVHEELFELGGIGLQVLQHVFGQGGQGLFRRGKDGHVGHAVQGLLHLGDLEQLAQGGHVVLLHGLVDGPGALGDQDLVDDVDDAVAGHDVPAGDFGVVDEHVVFGVSLQDDILVVDVGGLGLAVNDSGTDHIGQEMVE